MPRSLHLPSRDIPPELQRRFTAAGAVVLTAFLLLGVRLWYLQVQRGPDMRLLSEHNRVRLVRLPAGRGVVYDRYGDILVDNRPSFDIVLVPEDAGDRDAVVATLARYLGTDETGLLEVARAPSRRPPYQGIVLARDIDWKAVVAVETHQLDLPGVSLKVGPKRFYPFGALASHLLGYVGEVSERELGRDGSTYRAGDVIGKAGLERAWDNELRGVPGGEQVEVDALGRRVRVLDRVADTPGSTLTLTLDRDLQSVAERALGEQDGAVVALDPRSGEILVMASKPTFDPNVFARGIQAAEWQTLLQDPRFPLNNRATQGQYPPGSTFKMVVAAGALEETHITPFTRVDCKGGISFGKRVFRCWKAGGHGAMNVHAAIVQSCDVFFYQMGQQLGVDAIADYARRLGLGQVTGLDLEHEKSGLIPDTGWKRRRFDQPWFPGETLSVAIGQGYVTATPLQMASMTATIANGGRRLRPHYVKRVETPDGAVRAVVEPEVVGEAHIKESTLQAIRSAMRDVVMAERGTGRNARVLGVEVAGKTGTAQVVKLGGDRSRSNLGALKTRDHAWFVAYAPVEAPEIAIALIAEHAGGGGGAVAAPIVQEILAHYFGRTQGPPEEHAIRSTPGHAL